MSNDTIRTDARPGAPVHRIIRSENLAALTRLQDTHADLVDVIYIDPPYNTGSTSWTYNDRYKGWTGFMRQRLELARTLMKDTGFIFVAIGDAEHHRLRCEMDDVFGPKNFIGNIVWQGNRKNDARFLAGGLDYMVVYAKNPAALTKSGAQWREPKEGARDVLDAGAAAWKAAGGDPAEATRRLKQWHKELPKDHPARKHGNYNYTHMDDERAWAAVSMSKSNGGAVWRPDNLAETGKTGIGKNYDVLHPVTGKPVKKPAKGWRFSEDTMKQRVAQGRISFGPDETTVPRTKTFLDETMKWTPSPHFAVDRRAGSAHLKRILGEERFPFPKDVNVLMRWIRMAAPADGLVLDFFGGSGSTAEAVMRLNTEDGGTRQCILITNNELSTVDQKRLAAAGYAQGDDEYEAHGVFERVTRPRLSIVATGAREDGSTYEDTAPANLDFERWSEVETMDLPAAA